MKPKKAFDELEVERKVIKEHIDKFKDDHGPKGGTMKRFMVRVPEMYIQPVVIEATNKRDAIARIRAGEGDRTRRKILYCVTGYHRWRAVEIDKRGRAI